ncbi:MAG: hypothetical protein JWN73_411 [Betaproteobacteria bacterium]|nr:hypothetical protein [Betaproteobacteria bacterium]
MRFSVPCTALPAAPRLPCGWGARAIRILCAWLLAHFGQPAVSADEAFLAASTDHIDCERRQRWLAQRHADVWRALFA